MKVNQDTPEYWNKSYLNPYQDRVKGDHEFWYKFIDIVDANHNYCFLDILEIGCGVGQYVNYFSEMNRHKVLGIDYSEQAIKLCKERYPKYSFEVQNILNYNLIKKYDLIMCFEVLEHFNYNNLFKILMKVRKGLNQEGVFMCSVPDEKGKFGDFKEHLTLWNEKKIFDTFSKFFNQITFYNINSMCKGQQIFFSCKN